MDYLRKLFHWLTAAGLIVQIPLGLLFGGFRL